LHAIAATDVAQAATEWTEIAVVTDEIVAVTVATDVIREVTLGLEVTRDTEATRRDHAVTPSSEVTREVATRIVPRIVDHRETTLITVAPSQDRDRLATVEIAIVMLK